MNEKTLPKYAILSHTWGAEEVTYQDLRDGIPPAVQQKTGFTKIKWTCQQAKAEGLEFCWVDTCCIDKSSSAEISEAINSMFRYYVEVVAGAATDLYQSTWFNRGCTLRSARPDYCLRCYSQVSCTDYAKQGLCRSLLRRTRLSSLALLGCSSATAVYLQIHFQKSLA
jgi:hypothetical protein